MLEVQRTSRPNWLLRKERIRAKRKVPFHWIEHGCELTAYYLKGFAFLEVLITIIFPHFGQVPILFSSLWAF